MSASGLAAHLSPAELGQRYRAARSPVERSHLRIVWLPSRGRGEREVARVTGHGRRWVGEGARRYDEGGPDGRAARRRRAVDGAEGGDVDGGPARPRGLAATRLGLPQETPLKRPAAPGAATQGGGRAGAVGVQKTLAAQVDKCREAEPGRPVEVWAFDEHRLGL